MSYDSTRARDLGSQDGASGGGAAPGKSCSGVVFTTTTQQYRMTDTAGTMSIPKAGASAT